jgi:hypothetical protein
MQRVPLQFATGAGGETLKTGPLYGELLQARWVYSSGDTGGTLRLVGVVDNDADEAGDTGLNYIIAELPLAPAGWLKSPRVPVHGPNGLDTGVAGWHVPVALCLEHLKVTLVPGDTNGTAGRLWLTIGGGK